MNEYETNEQSTGEQLTYEQLYSETIPSVVSVYVTPRDANGPTRVGAGSGFIYGHDGNEAGNEDGATSGDGMIQWRGDDKRRRDGTVERRCRDERIRRHQPPRRRGRRGRGTPFRRRPVADGHVVGTDGTRTSRSSPWPTPEIGDSASRGDHEPGTGSAGRRTRQPDGTRRLDHGRNRLRCESVDADLERVRDS